MSGVQFSLEQPVCASGGTGDAAVSNTVVRHTLWVRFPPCTPIYMGQADQGWQQIPNLPSRVRVPRLMPFYRINMLYFVLLLRLIIIGCCSYLVARHINKDKVTLALATIATAAGMTLFFIYNVQVF